MFLPVTILLVVLILVPDSTYAAAFPQSSSQSTAEKKYAVICDAGSRGTRVKLFQYITDHHPPEVSDIKQTDVPKPDKSKPGLSTFANNIQGIEKYLGVLMESAKKAVPHEKQKSTPIFLFATAGMRLLKPEEKKAVLDQVDRLFLDKSFCPFHYEKGSARIISGEEEALYGWITVNFLKGTFSALQPKTSSFGALEMGGASTQNTFKIKKGNDVSPTFDISLAGKQYPIYAHSYLGNGANEAMDSYLKYLVKIQGQSKSGDHHKVISPCHNQGYKDSAKKIDDKSYILLGEYNSERCATYIRNRFFCKGPIQECPFLNQPKLIGDFYGFSAIYYGLSDSGILEHNDAVVPLNKIKTGVLKFCSQPNSNLDTKLFDVYGLCFRLNYIYELLKDGYKAMTNSFTLHVAEKLKGFDLSWTLGAMLHANKII